MSMRSNQRGSVVGFVIVGVVLASAVAGGVYFVNQRDKQAPAQPATSVQQPTPAPQSSNEKNSNSSTKESTGSQSTGTSNRTQGSTPTTGVDRGDSSHLPSTGPADQALQLIAFGALAGAGTAFIRSQRRKSSALSF